MMEVALLLLCCVHAWRLWPCRRLWIALVRRELRRSPRRSILWNPVRPVRLYRLRLVLLPWRPLDRRLYMRTSMPLLWAGLEWLLSWREGR